MAENEIKNAVMEMSASIKHANELIKSIKTDNKVESQTLEPVLQKILSLVEKVTEYANNAKTEQSEDLKILEDLESELTNNLKEVENIQQTLESMQN